MRVYWIPYIYFDYTIFEPVLAYRREEYPFLEDTTNSGAHP